MTEFWSMTPAETLLAMRAALWQQDLALKRDIRIAWHVAAFERQKRLPLLQRIFNPGKTRKLVGEELEKRRQEHSDLTERSGFMRENGARS